MNWRSAIICRTPFMICGKFCNLLPISMLISSCETQRHRVLEVILPNPDFPGRSSRPMETRPYELLEHFLTGFKNRKVSAGLLIVLIDFLINLRVSGAGLSGFNDLLERLPRQLYTAAGKRANTLIVATVDGNTITRRPFYYAAERLFRVQHKRFDCPNYAPHAAQVCGDYTQWLDALSTYSPKQMLTSRQRVCGYVLATLNSQEFDPGSVAILAPHFSMCMVHNQ